MAINFNRGQSLLYKLASLRNGSLTSPRNVSDDWNSREGWRRDLTMPDVVDHPINSTIASTIAPLADSLFGVKLRKHYDMGGFHTPALTAESIYNISRLMPKMHMHPLHRADTPQAATMRSFHASQWGAPNNYGNWVGGNGGFY